MAHDTMDVVMEHSLDMGMDLDDSSFILEHHDDPFGCWCDTLGLPEELIVHIFVHLAPKERFLSSLVSTTWRRIIHETWKLPYGDVKPALAFHALMTGKILRQCIPHVTWTVPHLGTLPANTDIYSPPFEQDHSLPHSAQYLAPTWRLKLRRLPPNISPEHPDLILSAELLRVPEAYSYDKPIRVHHYARIENPASYAWAEFHTGQSHVEPMKSSRNGRTAKSTADSTLLLLSSDVLQLTSTDRGFLVPPKFDSVQFKVMLARSDVEHVAVFTEEDSMMNRGPDLFMPSTSTIILHMEPDWLKCSQAEAQRHLKRALQRARPNADMTFKEFWRVIMRRNHSFRPVSKELKSYESPFYAVYALDVPTHDADKVCLFFKIFDGATLRYVGKRFGGPGHTLRTILRDYDLNTYALFEEVHSRRLDKIESVDISMSSMELGSGDVIVLCPRGFEEDLSQHYKSLVFTSKLVQSQPNMWHT
jgi:hypothetical protein